MDEIIYLKKRLSAIIAEHTGKSMEQITEDSDRDFYMSAEEACEYGLVDSVVNPKNLVAAGS